MSTTTHSIQLEPAFYTNVSNGNLNCTLVVPMGIQLRVHFGGEEPDVETKDFVLVSGGSKGAGTITALNLAGESDMWVSGDVEVTVIRGEAEVHIARS